MYAALGRNQIRKNFSRDGHNDIFYPTRSLDPWADHDRLFQAWITVRSHVLVLQFIASARRRHMSEDTANDSSHQVIPSHSSLLAWGPRHCGAEENRFHCVLSKCVIHKNSVSVIKWWYYATKFWANLSPGTTNWYTFLDAEVWVRLPFSGLQWHLVLFPFYLSTPNWHCQLSHLYSTLGIMSVKSDTTLTSMDLYLLSTLHSASQKIRNQ